MSAIRRSIDTLPSKTQVLRLYHRFLTNAAKFDNYNFREYFLRKTKYEFRQAQNLTQKQDIINAYNDALQKFDILKRQAEISKMYHFEKLVVEHSQPN